MRALMESKLSPGSTGAEGSACGDRFDADRDFNYRLCIKRESIPAQIRKYSSRSGHGVSSFVGVPLGRMDAKTIHGTARTSVAPTEIFRLQFYLDTLCWPAPVSRARVDGAGRAIFNDKVGPFDNQKKEAFLTAFEIPAKGFTERFRHAINRIAVVADGVVGCVIAWSA